MKVKEFLTTLDVFASDSTVNIYFRWSNFASRQRFTAAKIKDLIIRGEKLPHEDDTIKKWSINQTSYGISIIILI